MSQVAVNRRTFLQQLGVAAGGAVLPRHNLPGKVVGVCRALTSVPVRAVPDLSAPVVGMLLPDSVEVVHHLSADHLWYALAGGWVPRTAMQPIPPYHPSAIESQAGFWGRVAAPVTTVRAWCSAGAEVLTRLGWGAVVYVSDRLVADRGEVWYGVSADPAAMRIGWLPALHCQRWTADSPDVYPTHVIAGKRHTTMRIYEGDRLIADVPLFVTGCLKPCVATLRAVQPGGSHGGFPLGVPSMMQLGSATPVYGAFWHNDFGLSPEQSAAIAAIELPPLAAHWLYSCVQQSPLPVTIE